MSDPWKDVRGLALKIVDLGRTVVFFLPQLKLMESMVGEKTVEQHLKEFLLEEYGAFSVNHQPALRLMYNQGQSLVVENCERYEVMITGKKSIAQLVSKLACLAVIMDEPSIYFKVGEDACLIKPPPRAAR
ncbi:MAG: hypothetical protein WC551_00255 [Patescibacteria group bacterium]